MSMTQTTFDLETEHTFTAGLVAYLLIFSILFCAFYSLVLISSAHFQPRLSEGGGFISNVENPSTNAVGVVESEKPDRKESEIIAPPIPDRIVAPSIDLDATVVNPRSRDIAVLDTALLDGVVYYPGSGYLGEDSNLLLFGHSSFLPVVRNENFRVFNRIKDLEIGSEIEVYSDGEKFTYRVVSNVLAKESEVRIDFGSDVPRLTLATCNSFGAKEDRYVIEAVLVLN